MTVVIVCIWSEIHVSVPVSLFGEGTCELADHSGLTSASFC